MLVRVQDETKTGKRRWKWPAAGVVLVGISLVLVGLWYKSHRDSQVLQQYENDRLVVLVRREPDWLMSVGDYLPDSLFQSIELLEVQSDAQMAEIAGSVPRFGKLAMVELSGPETTNESLKHLTSAEEIHNLVFDNTTITDEGLNSLFPLQDLLGFQACHTPLTRKSLDNLKWQRRLDNVGLTDMDLSADDIESLCKSLNVSMWHLDGVPVSEESVATLSSKSGLNAITLRNTGLERLTAKQFRGFCSQQKLFSFHTDLMFDTHDLSLLLRGPKLYTLGLEGVQLNDCDLGLICRHHSLQILSVRGKRISVLGIGYLGNLPNLSFLSLSEVELNKEAIDYLSIMPSLNSIELRDIPISAEMMAGVAGLDLESLSLSDVEVEAEGWKVLANGGTFRRVCLKDMSITPEVLEVITSLRQLESLDASEIALTETHLPILLEAARKLNLFLPTGVYNQSQLDELQAASVEHTIHCR